MKRRDAGAASGGVTAFVLILFAAGVAFVAWTIYAATPQYATLKAIQALSARDYPAFARWVDVDAVAANATDAVLRSRLGAAPPAALRDTAVAAVKAGIRERVSAGIPGMPTDVPLVALVFGHVVDGASQTDDQAYVTAVPPGRSVRLDLRLRRENGVWRVVEVRNAAQVLGSGLAGWRRFDAIAILSLAAPPGAADVRVVEWQTR